MKFKVLINFNTTNFNPYYLKYFCFLFEPEYHLIRTNSFYIKPCSVLIINYICLLCV